MPRPGPGPGTIRRHARACGTDAAGDTAARRCRAARLPAPAASSASKLYLQAVFGDLPARCDDAPAFGRAVDQDRIGVVDVYEDAPRAQAVERRERAARTVERHVAHAPA